MDNNATKLSTTELSSFIIAITLLQSQMLPYIARKHTENSNLRKQSQRAKRNLVKTRPHIQINLLDDFA